MLDGKRTEGAVKGNAQGNDIGAGFDENDIIDLSEGCTENQNASAPSFHYMLKDVIVVKH